MNDTILIVDDSRTSRMFIQQALEIAGLQGASFLEAANGNEAMPKIRSEKVGVLVTDINMPGKGGVELIRELKDEGLARDLRIFVISSTQSPVRDAALREMGVEAILEKPINMGKMIATFGQLRKAV